MENDSEIISGAKQTDRLPERGFSLLLAHDDPVIHELIRIDRHQSHALASGEPPTIAAAMDFTDQLLDTYLFNLGDPDREHGLDPLLPLLRLRCFLRTGQTSGSLIEELDDYLAA
jgi:hypothetical protein